MTWAVYLGLWALPLTWLAVVVYPTYLRLITGCAVAALGVVGFRISVLSIEMLAPIDLALFAALALTSSGTPWRRRLGRLLAGWICLFLLDIAIVAAALMAFGIVAVSAQGPVQSLFENLTGLLGWVAAPILWLLLFGPPGVSVTTDGRHTSPRSPATGWSRVDDHWHPRRRSAGRDSMATVRAREPRL